MVIKVGINGFGRIGRVIFRKCLQTPDIEITAINDPAIDTEYICYLIKFDSTHGKFNGNISYTENEVTVDETKIKILHEKLPVNIPWVSVGAQYVVEASGMFTNMEKASGHLSSGVKRVIVTAPSLDVPMLIVGVNEHMIGIDDKVLSCASSTLYCLSPIVKVLEDKFGVTEGFVTSIHAMTPSLKPLDSLCLRGRHWRDHRSIHQNIIPATTGACKALHKIIPEIKDKLSGLAFRVPIVNVSVLDISIRLNRSTTMEDIVRCIHQCSYKSMKDIIKISNEEAVSSDFLGEHHSCILDVNSSFQLSPNFFKIVCWYENEHSYACRVVDTILFSERQFQHVFRPIAIESLSTGNTMDRCKSIFIPNNYSFQISPMSSASQDTGLKMKLFPRKLKDNTLGYRYVPAPQTTLRRVVNKTNEAVKINKIEDLNQLRNDGGPLFQTCLNSGPACVAQSRELRNHEQLEKVKREFSKVVNMTENLLKKSSHDTNPINKTNKHIPEVKPVVIDLDENKINDTKETITVNDFNDEPRPNESSVHIKNEEKPDCPIMETVHITHDSSRNAVSESTNLVEYEKSKLKSLPSISEVGMPQNNVTNIVNSVDFANNTLKLGQEDIICNMVQVFNNEIPTAECNVKDNITLQIDNRQITEEIEPNQLLCADQSIDMSKNFNNDSKSEPCVVQSENVTEEKDKFNFNKELEHNANGKKDMKDHVKPERLTIANKNQRMVERIIHRISINRLDATSAGTSRSASPCLSSISNVRPRRKVDIYDKLDSASGSDSETSFEEKKSQVINITDLTNSIEDLARLDKICRIIEISDELSDKLFSALSNSDCLDKNKSWSFKDLCERIKLDDFCNKVFGP